MPVCAKKRLNLPCLTFPEDSLSLPLPSHAGVLIGMQVATPAWDWALHPLAEGPSWSGAWTSDHLRMPACPCEHRSRLTVPVRMEQRRGKCHQHFLQKSCRPSSLPAHYEHSSDGLVLIHAWQSVPLDNRHLPADLLAARKLQTQAADVRRCYRLGYGHLCPASHSSKYVQSKFSLTGPSNAIGPRRLQGPRAVSGVRLGTEES